MKWVFPPLWIGGFGFGTCFLWFGAVRGPNGVPTPDGMKWAFLVAWLAGSSFILWFCGRLQRVQVDDESIYVSNYWSEVRVPFTEVSHITENRWISPPTVIIHLRDLSPNGERIVFISKFRWFPFGTHPVVGELQALTAQHEWPFADPKNVAVITMKSITMGDASIIHVTHDADDGMWQFLDGPTVREENASVVSLEEVSRIDPSIMELADLPV